MQPIAIYHEHPDWFKPLFAELERRGLPYVRLDAAVARLRSVGGRRAVLARRSTARARRRICAATGSRRSTRCTGCGTSSASAFRSSTARSVYAFELSKASQLDLLEELGLPYPRARAINHPSLARRRPRTGCASRCS